MNISINRYNLVVSAYLAIAFIFLFFFGIDAIEQRINFEFYADSETYHEYAEKGYTFSYLVDNFPNLIGPLTILYVVNSNYGLIFLINAIILFAFIHTVRKYLVLKNHLLNFLLLSSPLLFVSVVAINKEIFSLMVITLLIQFHFKRKISYLILAFIASFLVRWQLGLFVLSFAFIQIPIREIKPSYKLLVFLVFCSMIYFIKKDVFYEVNMVAYNGAEVNEGSGLFTSLINIQNANPLGYALVFLPKFLFLYMSKMVKVGNLFDRVDFHNNTIIVIQSFLNFVSLFLLIWTRRIFKLDFINLSLISYAIIFTLSPVYSPRYLFPIYIFSILSLTIKGNKVKIE